MLYIKKNNDTQTAFIPKNGSYEGKLSYKEGYEVGKAEGIAEGKNNPYSTKGFFFENGEKEFIYPVRINRDTMLPISFLGGNTSDYVEISFYPMGNGCVLANQNDSNIVCAMRGDLLRVFIYNTLQFELPCKQEEWHTLRLYTDRVILDGEETYFNTPYTGSSVVCACVNRGGNGFYRGLIQYMKGVEGEAVMYYISNLDESGFKRLRSDNGVSDWYENNFVPVWGAFPVMQTKVPLNSVFINVEGGNVCPELTELNVSENGRYEGAYNVVNVDVPDVNGSYDEGYNNGYNDGKAEGGSCNLEETRWGNPLPFDVNESYLIIQPSMGYDGMKKVALNMDDYNTEKYNEGYEAGKAEGGSCNLTELNIEWQSDWNENNYYADKQGYDGYSYVHIDATTALKEKYDEGYNFAIANDANLTPAKVEKKFDTLALRTENLYDGDIIRDRTKLRGFYPDDVNIENHFIAYTQNKNSIVICEQGEFTSPSVITIENGALDWNKIEYFHSFTIHTFGENMTRDMGSNVRELHIHYDWLQITEGSINVRFEKGCFATSNLLNKIVFYAPYYINVEENAFEGVSSSGKVIVVGEDMSENRAKYDDLMAQLGDGWTLTFVNEYNK